MKTEDQLDQGLNCLGLALPPDTQPRLLRYLALLIKWNRVYNLTAVREPTRLISYHLLDSLAVLPYLDGETVLDVGSGAGLPGIPLAIVKPDWEFTLLDSNHKKGAFLRQVILELSLQNTRVVTVRAEEWKPAHCFDTVISRAFADLAAFWDTARHLCCSEGTLAAMKGIYPHEELAQLESAAHVQRVVAVHVPGLRSERHLVLLRAAART